MIKTFLFDLGNVLLFFSHARMFEQIQKLTGMPLAAVESLLATNRLQWRYEAGEVTTGEIYRGFADASPRKFTLEELMYAVSDIFRPNESMLPVLRALKAKGYRLVIVSNTNEAHMQFALPRFECFQCFDELIFSYEVRSMKPDRPFYVAAHRAALCDPNECLFTDDLAENVAGAEAYGFNAVLFTGADDFLRALPGFGVEFP